MTNKQFLLNQIQNMSDEELVTAIIHKFDICKSQLKGKPEHSCTVNMGNCIKCYIDWLNQEHKEPIKLSDAERVILENISKKYEWILRDEDGELKVYADKPCKTAHSWFDDGCKVEYLDIFNHLFQFIKWEDENPYNIEELLK